MNDKELGERLTAEVTTSCLKDHHLCATCRERIRAIKRYGYPKRLLPMIVAYLRRYPKGNVTEMATIFNYPEYVVSLCVDKLEKEGLIELEANP